MKSLSQSKSIYLVVISLIVFSCRNELTKSKAEEIIKPTIAKNKQEKLFIGNLIYREENWNTRPDENICGRPCDANIKIISRYQPLVDKNLIQISETDKRIPSGFSFMYKKYYVISLTDEGLKYSDGERYSEEPPCQDCCPARFISGCDEEYFTVKVKLCDLAFDQINQIKNYEDREEALVSYSIKVINLTPFGIYFGISENEKYNSTLNFIRNTKNEWSIQQN